MFLGMVLMSAERRISDEDLARLRLLGEEGWSLAALAARFGISATHVGRLLRGVQRPSIASSHDDGEAVGAADAVAAFLAEESDLSGADEVLAAVALLLAQKLDGCAASDAAAAAQAMPRLAAQLVAVLDALRDGALREPDAVDLLRARRDARLANGAATAAPHFNKPQDQRRHR
jgi:transcriptional regulator with XRE-family HTH domain